MLDDGWYFKALSSDETTPSNMGLLQDVKSRKRVWGPEMADLGGRQRQYRPLLLGHVPQTVSASPHGVVIFQTAGG